MPVHRNRLNNEQTIKINMFDEVDTNFVTNDLMYGANAIINGKISLFEVKMNLLHIAIIKKLHDATGDRPAKEVLKENLAKYVSRKGRTASVYFKSIANFSTETLLDKSWTEIYEMKDTDCIAFCTEANGIFGANVLPLTPYGINAGVITIIDDDILAFTNEKPIPVSSQLSKNAGGEEIDALNLVIIDILHDLDKMIPDAFGDTNPIAVRDYVQKRVEHTVGNRHNIVVVTVKKNPGDVPAPNSIFTVKDVAGNIIKQITMGLDGTNTIDSIRNREYIYEVSHVGFPILTGTFHVAYRDTLTLDFTLNPI